MNDDVDEEEFLTNPNLFLQSFDFGRRLAVLAEIEESDLRARTVHSFGDRANLRTIPFDRLLTIDIDRARLNEPSFIFMTDFCGSTLLFSILRSLRDVQGLNEVKALAMLSMMRRTMDSAPSHRPGLLTADDWLRLLRLTVHLLGRTYPGKRTMIVKEWPLSNYIIEDILGLSPSIRAIFLHSSLRDYANAVFRRANRRAFVRNRVVTMLTESGRWPEIHRGKREFSDAQIVAAHWFIQRKAFVDLAPHREHQIRSVDGSDLFEDPVGVAHAVATHFGLDGELEDLAAGARAVQRTHSKRPETPYSVELRKQEISAVEGRCAEEIAEAVGNGRHWSGMYGLPARLQWPISRLPASMERRSVQP